MNARRVEENVELVENMLQKKIEEKKKIALTFDDGPHPVYTKQVLEGLKKRNIHATFFLVGENIQNCPEIVRQMHEEGHLIGNHTYSHLTYQKRNLEAYVKEIETTNELIEQITHEKVLFFRPPCGYSDKMLEDRISQLVALWTVDPMDWSIQNSDQIVKKVVTSVQENDIILLHDEYETSVTAALRIVDLLSEEGYEFVTLEEIMLE